MRRSSHFVIAYLFLAAASQAVAQPAYDMSGKWLLVVAETPNRILYRMDLTQADGEVSQWPAHDNGSTYWRGTIDYATGSFRLTGGFGGACDPTVLEGSVAADGRTFIAAAVYDEFIQDHPCCYECDKQTFMVLGTRCGNRQLEEWEECDAGNAADGDCCSSSCLIDAAGTACTSDGTECTSDQCDDGGVCQHIAVAGPCVEPNGCGTGECSDGACVVTAPAPSGVPCDLDGTVCTPDTCEGDGSCVAGEPVRCWPCGVCNSVQGCIRDPEQSCDDDPARVRLLMKTTPRTKQNRLKLLFETYPWGMGDPTDSTTFSICVYEVDGDVERPIFAAIVPPGGVCGEEDCWQESGYGGYRYYDPAGKADGITGMAASTWRGFEVKGTGENLPLPSSLPPATTFIPTITAWRGFYDGRCWSHPLTGESHSSTRFRAEYRAEP
ncbi:MAG TPA: hypothetical protein VEC57_19635 [Candidatus Limnocylindrales bacterium]|nr:hypothetical protein [Candidatus Limnocylindrales bacterium]